MQRDVESVPVNEINDDVAFARAPPEVKTMGAQRERNRHGLVSHHDYSHGRIHTTATSRTQ